MKNERLKGGYGMVSNTVMRNPDLSLREKGIYAYLATYSNTDNELTVSINRMAAECGVTPSTIKRIIESLKEKGVIMREIRGNSLSYRTVLLK